MGLPSYGALWRARALADTKEFWSPTKTVLQVAGPIFAGIAWVVFKPWGGWWPIMQIAAISILGFLALWGLAYMTQLCLAPGKIHAEQQDSISILSQTVSDLNSKPQISEIEQARRQLVTEKLSNFSQQEKAVIYCILQHGSVSEPYLSERFGIFVAPDVISKAAMEGLLEPLSNWEYSIKSIFHSALADYFAKNRPVTPSSD